MLGAIAALLAIPSHIGRLIRESFTPKNFGCAKQHGRRGGARARTDQDQQAFLNRIALRRRREEIAKESRRRNRT